MNKREKRQVKSLKTTTSKIGIAVIITQANHVLLTRRKALYGAGAWTVPGGYLHHGETLEACAMRAAKEKVALTITDLAFRAITNDLFTTEGTHQINIWMEGIYVVGEPGIQTPDEISDVGWFSWNTLPEPLFLPFQHLLMGQCYPAPWNFNE